MYDHVLEFAIYHTGHERTLDYYGCRTAFSSILLDYLSDCIQHNVIDEVWVQVSSHVRNPVHNSVRNYIQTYSTKILVNYLHDT